MNKWIVVKKQANLFTCSKDNQTIKCSSRGILKKNNIVVGDYVEINLKTQQIEKVYGRKNQLIRPPLANLDNLFILVAEKPKPDFLLLDKLLLFCKINNIFPIIVHCKVDLSDNYKSYIKKVYGKFFTIIEVSALKNLNIDKLKTLIKGKISAFCGQSGVGKSTLINAIFGENKCVVDELSKKIERGKNTTKYTELFKVDNNSFIADTAGFSSLNTKYLPLQDKELPYYYPDFLQFLKNCQFKSCQHLNENNCGVKEAIKNNEIDKNRYKRYLIILEDLKRNKF